MVKYFDAPYEDVHEEFQKITFDVLQFLETKKVIARIAGGCLRDWRINQQINDIDFFIEVPQDSKYEKWNERLDLVAQINAATFSNFKNKSHDDICQNKYDQKLFVYESPFNNGPYAIKLQLIFVPTDKLGSVVHYITSKFDFNINKGVGYYDRANAKIRFATGLLEEELRNATITFNLTNLIDDKWALGRVVERSQRFQEKLKNFNIRIV